MKSIAEIIGLETIELAQSLTGNSAGQPMGKKSTPQIERIELAKLEEIYLNDPVVFNSINKTVEVIMSAGYTLKGSDESISYVEEFLDNIGTRGGYTEWMSLLETIFTHQCIYGRAFNEIIYNAKQTKIMDLDFVDPKKIDYAKNMSNRIALDKYSNPLGYVLSLPYMEMTGDLKSDPVPSQVYLNTNQIFLKPERLAHYKLYTLGDGFYGIGLVEPIYKTANRKLKMEEALANVYMRTGFPTRMALVGDKFHEPTLEMLQRATEELEKSTYRSVFATPYYNEVKILEANKPEKLRQHLDHFVEEENTGLGLPSAFATWKGGEVNRATLNRQEFLYKLSLKEIINKTIKTLERDVFSKIAKLNNLKDTPRIKWNEINLEELDSKSKRLVAYTQSGLITPDKQIETIIRQQEGLPPKPRTRQKEE